jgi:hypothetical protein
MVPASELELIISLTIDERETPRSGIDRVFQSWRSVASTHRRPQPGETMGSTQRDNINTLSLLGVEGNRPIAKFLRGRDVARQNHSGSQLCR